MTETPLQLAGKKNIGEFSFSSQLHFSYLFCFLCIFLSPKIMVLIEILALSFSLSSPYSLSLKPLLLGVPPLFETPQLFYCYVLNPFTYTHFFFARDALTEKPDWAKLSFQKLFLGFRGRQNMRFRPMFSPGVLRILRLHLFVKCKNTTHFFHVFPISQTQDAKLAFMLLFLLVLNISKFSKICDIFRVISVMQSPPLQTGREAWGSLTFSSCTKRQGEAKVFAFKKKKENKKKNSSQLSLTLSYGPDLE